MEPKMEKTKKKPKKEYTPPKETNGEATLKDFFKKNNIKIADPVSKDELVTINIMIVKLLWVHAMHKKAKDLNELFGFSSDRVSKDLASGIKNTYGAHSASEKYINSFCKEKLQIPVSDFNGENLLIPDVNYKTADKPLSMRLIYKELVAYRRLSVMANHTTFFLHYEFSTRTYEIDVKILKGLLSEDDWKEVTDSLPLLKNYSLKTPLPEKPKEPNKEDEEDYVLSLIDYMQKDEKVRQVYFDVLRSLKRKYENILIERLKKYYDNSKMTSEKQSYSFFKLLYYLKYVYDNPAVHTLVTSITKQMKQLDTEDFTNIVKLPDSTKDAYIEELTRQLDIFRAAKYY